MLSEPQKQQKKPASRSVWASQWWFPLVSIYAAAVVPLSLWSMTRSPGLPGLATPAGHAADLLFGVVMGMVAGYLSGKQPRKLLWLTLLVWVSARALSWGWPGSLMAIGFQCLFIVLLLYWLLPRLGAAKRWRNRSLLWLLVGLGALALWTQAGATLPTGQTVLAASTLFALLMVYIGGRAIAPAAAGEHGALGYDLPARLQPGLEGVLILSLALATASCLTGWYLMAGLLMLVAGAAVLIRLLRWRLWRLYYRHDLMVLSLGYAWVAVALLVLGWQLMQGLPWRAPLHLLTVGALGTLSITMMAKVTWQRTRKHRPPAALLWGCALLVVAATGSRTLFPSLWPEHSVVWLWLASLCWSLAYLVCAFALLRVSSTSR